MDNQQLENDNSESGYETTSGMIQNGLNRMLPKGDFGPTNEKIMEHFGL